MKKLLTSLVLAGLFLIGTGFKTKKERIIDLKHSNGLYFVTLQLNNREGNFLVDTGAIMSLLDVSQSSTYKFRANTIQDAKFMGLGGLKNRYSVSNYNIAHDEGRLAIHFQGVDMSELVENAEGKHMAFVGIIGGQYLRSVQAVIDYKNDKLIVYEWE